MDTKNSLQNALGFEYARNWLVDGTYTRWHGGYEAIICQRVSIASVDNAASLFAYNLYLNFLSNFED